MKGRLRGWGIILVVGLVAALASVPVVGAVQRRLVPPANKVTATITVGGHPVGVAAAGGVVWVTNQFDKVSRIE